MSLLSQTAINLGFTDPRLTPTVDGNRLKQIANKFVRRLDMELPRMNAGDAFMIISSYDFAYRVAYGRGAEQSFIGKYTLNAFESLIKGDKSIDEYEMYRAIELAIRLRNRAFLDRPLRWNSISLERWYKTFQTGKAMVPMSDYDTIMCISILLSADLGCILGSREESFKKYLFTNHSHYLDRLLAATSSDLITHQLDLIRALQSLLHSSFGHIPIEKYFTYQDALHATQLASPYTNRYLRVTLTIQRQAICT